MTRDELLHQFEKENPGNLDWETFQSWLIDYVLRLRNGQWTKEEIHDLCHNLPKTVSLEEFQEGCRKEQEKIYRCWFSLSDLLPKQKTIVEVKRPDSTIITKAIIAHGGWRDWKTFEIFYPDVDMIWRYAHVDQ